MSGQSTLEYEEDALPSMHLSGLLKALCVVLRGTILRFEAAGAEIATGILECGYSKNNDLIVALQNFDRLQQEFSALCDVIERCAAMADATRPGKERAASQFKALEDIKIADIRDRLLACLGQDAIASAGEDSFAESEKVF